MRDEGCTRTVKAIMIAICYASGSIFSFILDSNVIARSMRLLAYESVEAYKGCEEIPVQVESQRMQFSLGFGQPTNC